MYDRPPGRRYDSILHPAMHIQFASIAAICGDGWGGELPLPMLSPPGSSTYPVWHSCAFWAEHREETGRPPAGRRPRRFDRPRPVWYTLAEVCAGYDDPGVAPARLGPFARSHFGA